MAQHLNKTLELVFPSVCHPVVCTLCHNVGGKSLDRNKKNKLGLLYFSEDISVFPLLLILKFICNRVQSGYCSLSSVIAFMKTASSVPLPKVT